MKSKLSLYRGRVAHTALGVGGRDCLSLTTSQTQTQKPLIDLSPLAHPTTSSQSFHPRAPWGEIPCSVERDSGLETQWMLVHWIFWSLHPQISFKSLQCVPFNVWKNWSLSETFFPAAKYTQQVIVGYSGSREPNEKEANTWSSKCIYNIHIHIIYTQK